MTTYILSLLVILYIIYRYYKSGDFLYLFLLAAFLLRLLLIAFDIYYNLFPYSWDADFYHSIALQIKDNIVSGRFIYHNIDVSLHVGSYSTIQAFLYLVTGSIRANMRVFNAFVGVFIAKKVYDITYYIYKSGRAALLSTLMLLFWPSFILFTSLNMRESIYIYFTFTLLYGLHNFKPAVNKENLLLLVSLLIMFLFKVPTIIMAILIFVIFSLVNNIKRGNIKVYQACGIFIILLLVGMLMINIGIIPGFSLHDINGKLIYRTDGGSRYLSGMKYDTAFHIILYLPLRFVYFLFGPFIWQATGNLFMITAALDGLLIFIMTVLYFYLFIKKGLYRNNYDLLLFLFMLIGVAGNAVFDSNFGTAFRHRIPYIVILFIYINYYYKRVIRIVDFHCNSNKE